MFQHEMQIRVRYGETDQMGYLYYGNYAKYYEIGRTEAFRTLGMPYSDLEKIHGIMLPVVSMNTRYIRPAYYDDLLTIRTTVRHLPNKFFKFFTEIYNEKGKLVNGGEVKLCFVDSVNRKSIVSPDYIIEHLQPYFEK